MTAAAAGLLAAAAVLVVTSARGGAAAARLRALTSAAEATPGRAADAAGRLRLLAAAGAAAAALALVPLPVGVAVAVAAAAAADRILRRVEPAAQRRRSERLAAELPLALDLLSACLSAGGPVEEALAVVGSAIGGPMEETLVPVASALRLGAPPSEAFSELADDPATAELGRLLTRALEGGAAPADVVRRLADDSRAAALASASEDVRRIGVAVVAPLGLCFLPAFVLLGVVPVVAGMARQVLA